MVFAYRTYKENGHPVSQAAAIIFLWLDPAYIRREIPPETNPRAACVSTYRSPAYESYPGLHLLRVSAGQISGMQRRAYRYNMLFCNSSIRSRLYVT